MFCPSCRAAVEDDDAFCPKCGAGVTYQTRNMSAGAAAPGSLTVGLDHQAPPRPEAPRVPIVEGGTKYPGLVRVAELSIRGGEVLGVLTLILSVLATVSYLVANLGTTSGIYTLLVAACIGISIYVFGRLASLGMIVQGELIHLAIDVEEDLRRRH